MLLTFGIAFFASQSQIWEVANGLSYQFTTYMDFLQILWLCQFTTYYTDFLQILSGASHIAALF